MAFQDSAVMDESLPPPEASPTRPASRGFDPSANPPLPPSDQPKPDEPPPPPYHHHIPITDPKTGRPTGDNVTDQGQYGSPIVSAGPIEPYIPTRHDYPHTQWGEDDWALRGARKYPGLWRTPYMPQENDMAPLLHGLVMWFGRFGSPHVAIPAIAMGNYASAYWTAYQKGMHERAGTAWQQYQHAQRMMLDRQKQELSEASQIMALYGDDPKRLHDEMMTLSAKYGNDKYLEAAAAKGPAAIEAWLSAKNGKYLDAAKLAQQQEAAAQLKRLRELEIQRREKALQGEPRPPEWGPRPPGGGAAAAPSTTTTEDDPSGDTKLVTGDDDTEPDTGITDTDTEPTDTETQDKAEPGTTAPPTRYAEADIGTKTDASSGAAPARPGATQADVVAQAQHIATPEDVNRRIDDVAKSELRGEAAPKNVPKDIQSRIEARKTDLEKELNGLLSSGLMGQDLMDKLKAFDPVTARTVDDLVHGRRILAGGGLGGTASAARQDRLSSFAGLVRPGWGPEIANFRREFVSANGATQKSLLAATSMTGAAERVLRALQYIGEDELPPENWIDQVISNKFTGSPQWSNLGSALNSYIEESAKLARGGQSAEGDINRVLTKYAPLGMGPKAIRALLANEAGVAASQIQAKLNQWKQATWETSPPIGYDGEAFQFLKSLENLNMMTGGVPQPPPVPERLAPYLGPAGSKKAELTKSKGESTTPASPYKPGDVKYGYKFKGGDWKKQENWEKVD